MASLKELRDSRIVKLEKLKSLGFDPYPAISKKDFDHSTLTENFSNLENEDVTTSGRILSIRSHGKIAFIDLKDASGRIQILLKDSSLGNLNPKYSELDFENINLLDSGDFLEVSGKLLKTARGEITIEARKIRLLTKSLRPLPDAWDGLKDKEVRIRRRYLDTNINEDVYQRFVRRARFWEAHRLFLRERGFYEINVPVLEQIPGGADANPFITHMDAIDQDFYLRISHELYLKRLIGGGYERVYEIGPRFRNEGLSDEHLPEHMAMEFYWAYADWKEGMRMVKELFDYVIKYVYGNKRVFRIRGFDVDFSKDWEVIDFASIMKQRYGFDVHSVSEKEIEEILKSEGIPVQEGSNILRGIDSLWKKIRRSIVGPAFLINHPKFMSPLAKAKVEELHIAERFQPIIAGSELGNGWSENNSPMDQLHAFIEQQKMREAGDPEAQWLDIDYIEMLEYGMPPTFGYGHSERVFWFLEDVTAREGVVFPQLKFELEESTKEIYPFVEEIYSHQLVHKVEKNQEIKITNTDDSKDREKNTFKISDILSREEGYKLLYKHVKDDYQIKHSVMVASVLERYAEKFGEDKDLWFLTGLLHDLDYYEFPNEHPKIEIKWFEDMGLPEELIHAVKAHALSLTGEVPQTKLASCILATDELCGLVHAYSLMRPNKYEGMEASSVLKKFKDKTFASKIDREEIKKGVEYFGEDMKEHIDFVISVLRDIYLKDVKND